MEVIGFPHPKDDKLFAGWLRDQPRAWSITISARAALRVLPFLRRAGNNEIDAPVFRAVSIASYAANYPNSSVADHALTAAKEAAEAARGFPGDIGGYVAAAVSAAAYSVSDDPSNAAARTISYVSNVVDDDGMFIWAVTRDLHTLVNDRLTTLQLAHRPIWPSAWPRDFADRWRAFRSRIASYGDDWFVWITWYENILRGGLNDERWHAAYTDVPGALPWRNGIGEVNFEIAQRLGTLERIWSELAIPEQALAPVRVQERNGKIAKESDRNSGLSASERDFNSWRDPVVDHIGELSNGDFRAGTNHGRVRDRLTALGGLLPGEIAEIKERQFRIGYEIERFEGLLVAYKTGGDDMPQLNAAQLADLDHLQVALKMGINKLERWAEFRRQVNDSSAGEGDADREVVAEALDQMAVAMEQRSDYFHPELPESFRALADAARDPKGATKTVVFGAVRSAENLISFLGRRALDIGKKAVDAVEGHISKGVAAMLIAGLGGAALQLSGALPQSWAWLKPLLEAASKAIGVP